MKAAFIREFGGIENLQIGDLPEPEPGAGEVKIAVKASALNHLDIWVRKGRPGLSLKKAHIMGSDASGVVEATGDDVTGIQVGDEVVVNAGIGCGRCEFCNRGLQSECADFQLLGFQQEGLHAEKAIVPAANLGPKPAHLSWEEAAALSLAHLTAWRMIFTRAQYQPGESALIHGIGGGVALAALQMITACGGQAIVTSSSDEKLAKAKKLGATHGLNYRTSADVASKVKELTNGRGVDLAIDSVGAPTLPISLNALRRGGRIVTCGVTGGPDAIVNMQGLYWNHYSILGSTMGSREDHRQMLAFVSNTRITPVLDQVYPLARYPDAIKRMEAGDQFGKIVLKVG